MEVTLKLLKELILEERLEIKKNRKKYLLSASHNNDIVEEAALGTGEVMKSIIEKEKEEKEKEAQEEKKDKEQERKEAEEEIADPLSEVEAKGPPIFEFLAGVIVEREVNLDDVYGMIRAIEGVTIVSTEAESRPLTATLERVILKIKFIKGLTSLRSYKTELATAMLRVRGISSVDFIKVRKLPA
tara:strand:- start:2470 stop:3027 length:558 start_codon:yes stop_codon:yes gene_type:complete